MHAIASTLQPEGTLGFIWNIEDYNHTLQHASPHPWTLTLRKLLFQLDDESPADTPALRFRNETWRQCFTDPNSPFAPIQETEFFWTTYLDEEALWARFRTLSQIAAMEGPRLVQTRTLFDEALRGESTERDAQGRIAVRGSTLVVWTRKSS